MNVKVIRFAPVLTVGTLALAYACGSDKPSTPTQPTPTPTLATPVANAPTGGVQIDSVRPTLEVKNAVATGTVGTVKYQFQVSEEDGFPGDSRTVSSDPVDQDGSGTTKWQVPQDLIPNKTYFWHARATNGTITTSYSNTESFKTQNRGLRNGQTVFDPLTNGQTVGTQIGGTFVSGRGWQAINLTDGIDYDIPTMRSGSLEFDITGVQSDEPGPYDIGMKFYSMGDGSAWDFTGFRNGPYKASLDKKSGRVYAGESGVVEHIFRVVNDDNRTKTGQRVWHDAQTYHVKLVWGSGHVRCTIDNDVIADENYGGDYAPANHRIELGCRPRTETLKGAIWSNVVIGPR